MMKRIVTSLVAVVLVIAIALPALALETPEERRNRRKLEAQKLPTQAEEAMKAQDYEKAVELYTKAIDSGAFDDPQHVGNLYFGRGVANRGKKDCPSAINDLNKALETIKKGDIYFTLAGCHLDMNQDDLALGDLDNAVKIDPDAVNYRAARCKLLFNRRDFAGALPDCEKALAVATEDKTLMVATAQAAEQVGNKTRAAEVYRKLLALEPGNTVATEGLKRTGS
jgi:tetratricopeptide (TPR) repeat protein